MVEQSEGRDEIVIADRSVFTPQGNAVNDFSNWKTAHSESFGPWFLYSPRSGARW